MARPRKEGREHFPTNLHIQNRGGKDYFTYRNPVTGKSMALGYDCRAAINFALKANRGVIDPIVVRASAGSNKELLPYEDLVALAQNSSGRPGVYFLFQGDDLVYIGKSNDVEYRIGQHRSRNKITFDRVAIVPCAMSELTKLEARYIRKYTPFFNVALPLALEGET